VERLEHNVVAFLRTRRAIPRTMKRDQCATVVSMRKAAGAALCFVKHHVIGRPVAREPCDGRGSSAAKTGFLAVAAILGCEHELLLRLVEIALRPAVIGALLELDHFFRWQFLPLLRGIEFRPVLMKLIAPVLRREDMARSIKRDAFAVANTAHVAAGRRE